MYREQIALGGPVSYNFDREIDRRGSGSLKWDKYRDTDILPMWVADMDLPMADEISHAMSQRMEHPFMGYTVATETTSAAVCDWLRSEFDWDVSPDHLVWLPGVVPGMWAACAAVGAPGDEAVFSTPIYHHFFHVPGQGGKTAKPVPLLREPSGRWTYDFDALNAAMSARTRLMLLCSPHNPTGTLFSVEEQQRMAQLCEAQDLVILSDEVHNGLVLSESNKHVPLAKAYPACRDRLITLMSPSKTFNLAGMQCAFAIIENPQLRRQYIQAMHSVLPQPATLAFTALEAAFTHGKAWHDGLIAHLRKNHALLETAIAAMPGLSMSPMEATYLAWLDTSALGVENPMGFFETHGVGLSAGADFGRADFLRLNFACPQPQLELALTRMRTAIESR
ncbi:MAG TPA: aspartate aminotransferase [Gammaproteobacteria bacterium]|nr:aspartate aminotransferase [Gammaproteobacteria bacterium]